MNFKSIPDSLCDKIASFLDEDDINQFIYSGLVKFSRDFKKEFVVYKTFKRIWYYECSDSYYNYDFMKLACKTIKPFILVGLIKQFANHIITHAIFKHRPEVFTLLLDVVVSSNINITVKTRLNLYKNALNNYENGIDYISSNLFKTNNHTLKFVIDYVHYMDNDLVIMIIKNHKFIGERYEKFIKKLLYAMVHSDKKYIDKYIGIIKFILPIKIKDGSKIVAKITKRLKVVPNDDKFVELSRLILDNFCNAHGHL